MKHIYLLCECNYLKIAIKSLLDKALHNTINYKVLDLVGHDLSVNSNTPIDKYFIYITTLKKNKVDTNLLNFLLKIKVDKRRGGADRQSEKNYYINIYAGTVGCIFIEKNLQIEVLSQLMAKIVQSEYRLYENCIYKTLSTREIEVLRYLSRGFTVIKTSKALGLSIKTVSAHKVRGLRKMGYEKINF